MLAVTVAYCAEVELFRRDMVVFSDSLWATCCWTRLARVASSEYAPPCGSSVPAGKAYVLTEELFGCRAERKTPSDTTLMSKPSNSVTVTSAKRKDKKPHKKQPTNKTQRPKGVLKR